jgi:hypothetical protein
LKDGGLCAEVLLGPGQGRSKAVPSVLKRLLVLNNMLLRSRAGKMEALVLRSCWVQARARFKAVSSVLKRLLVFNSVR